MLFDTGHVEWIKYINKTPKVFNKDPEAKAFDLSLPISTDWQESDKRILFVLGHVTTEDLFARRLIGGEVSKRVTNNLIKYGVNIAQGWGNKVKINDFAVAAINFNFFKNYHMHEKDQDIANRYAAKRVKKFIQKYRPTHVVFSGGLPAFSLLEEKYYKNFLRPFSWKLEGKRYNTIVLPDIGHALDKNKSGNMEQSDDEKELQHIYNLQLFGEGFAALLNKKYPWQIKKFKVNPVYIDSKKKFKKLVEPKLAKAKVVAIDTEGTSLSAHLNKTQTIQLAFDVHTSYIIPIYHKDSTFNKTDFEYIVKSIREFLMQDKEPSLDEYLLFYNAKYDLKVLRTAFKIPVIQWSVYDIMAGEHQLNENKVSLSAVFSKLPRTLRDNPKVKEVSKQLGLANVFAYYGQDFYFTHEFSKEARVTIVANELSQPVLEYAGCDCQALFAIRDQQFVRAKLEKHKEDGKEISFYDDFKRMTIYQMSNNIHDFASMEINGFYTSISRLRELKRRGGSFDAAQQELFAEFKAQPEVKKANKILLEKQGVLGKGNMLYIPWVFDWNKKDHVELLFSTVMQLEIPVSKKGGLSFGKEFKNMYKEQHTVVDIYTQLTSIKQLRSSFINTFSEHLNSPQGRITQSIIPDFGFATIVTGRSNSSKPSLQQIPEHGALAKPIKEIFITKKGKLKLKMDYSAHEVRCWGITSKDSKLAGLFSKGYALRKKLITATGKKAKKLLKLLALYGDIHRINGSFFFDTPIEKVDDETRQGTKGVVFGLMFGRAAATLAKQLNKAVKYAENLYLLFFNRYVVAKSWLDRAEEKVIELGFNQSILGRRRRLIGGVLTGMNDVIGAMQRRSKNAPIQGMGADLGFTGARLFELHFWEFYKKFGTNEEFPEYSPLQLDIMVHDSIFTLVDIEYALPAMYIMQWCCTKGNREYYKKYFGFDFNVPLEIELELGTDNANTYKWNWQLYDEILDEKLHKKAIPLNHVIERTIKDYLELYPEETEKDVRKRLNSLWDNKKVQEYILKNYPIMPD